LVDLQPRPLHDTTPAFIAKSPIGGAEAGWRSLHDGAEAGAIDTETGVGSARFVAQSPPQHWIVDRSGTGSPGREVSANERRHMAGTVAEALNVHTLVFPTTCPRTGL